MADEFTAVKEYKKIKREDMMKFIAEKHPEDKEWFKKVAFQNKKGEDLERYNHLNAVKCFCERYAKSLLPKKKAKGKDIFENW